jgi:hypothetical protein
VATSEPGPIRPGTTSQLELPAGNSVQAALPVPGALPLLTTYVILLWGIPSQLTVGALGSLGRPSTLWGLFCLAWWGWIALIRVRTVQRPRQPVRIATAVFLIAVWSSYAIAHSFGMPADEISPSDSGLIRTLSWAGVVLLANDGITDADRFRILLRRIVTIGGLFAALGVAQFVTGSALIDSLTIPGLVNDSGLSAVQERGGFTRASATAAHPLEYAVVLSATLPLALAFGVGTQGGALRRWWPTFAIAVASVVSVSRSAIIGLAVSVAVLMPALGRRARAWLLVGMVVLAAGAYVTVPGLIGTIRGLFLGAGQDDSIKSRTGAFDAALEIADNYGPLGRGFGTFLPKYYILDNQLLLLYIEIGAVGLAAFLGLVCVAMVQAQRARRRDLFAGHALLSQALTASLVATTVLYAFFDAFSFTMAGGTLFLLTGMCGAAANVTSARSVPAPNSHGP